MRVYFTNFGYVANPTFLSVEAAVEFGKSCGFEFVVQDSKGSILASWSPIGGLRV